jgi:hypothetical protein
LKGQQIGYVRVSSFDQHPERQLDCVQLDKVFTDKASGKDTLRPELDALQSFVREGDTVVVHSMDRLARNLDDLRHLVQKLTKRGVHITFVTETDLALIRQRRGDANRLGFAVQLCLLRYPGSMLLSDMRVAEPESGITWLVWLRQSPVKPNSRHMLEQIERLKTFQKLALPAGIGQSIHQNRLLKMAREGGRMTPQDLAKFEDKRRYATLVALALEGTATVTDQLIDLHVCSAVIPQSCSMYSSSMLHQQPKRC